MMTDIIILLHKMNISSKWISPQKSSGSTCIKKCILFVGAPSLQNNGSMQLLPLPVLDTDASRFLHSLLDIIRMQRGRFLPVQVLLPTSLYLISHIDQFLQEYHPVEMYHSIERLFWICNNNFITWKVAFNFSIVFDAFLLLIQGSSLLNLLCLSQFQWNLQMFFCLLAPWGVLNANEHYNFWIYRQIRFIYHDLCLVAIEFGKSRI